MIDRRYIKYKYDLSNNLYPLGVCIKFFSMLVSTAIWKHNSNILTNFKRSRSWKIYLFLVCTDNSYLCWKRRFFLLLNFFPLVRTLCLRPFSFHCVLKAIGLLRRRRLPPSTSSLFSFQNPCCSRPVVFSPLVRLFCL